MLERLRPLLVDKDTRRPDWVVLMATLGGVAVFGINGSVIGPMTGAIFFAAWQIMLLDWRGTLSEGDDGTG